MDLWNWMSWQSYTQFFTTTMNLIKLIATLLITPNNKALLSKLSHNVYILNPKDVACGCGGL